MRSSVSAPAEVNSSFSHWLSPSQQCIAVKKAVENVFWSQKETISCSEPDLLSHTAESLTRKLSLLIIYIVIIIYYSFLLYSLSYVDLNCKKNR